MWNPKLPKPSLIDMGQADAELVGQELARAGTDDGRTKILFRCTNKEEMEFYHPPAIKPLPSRVVRCWTSRIPNPDGSLSRDSVLIHWEEL